MKKLLAVFWLFAFPAHALDVATENAMLKDYIGLTKVMKVYGIEPVAVNWNEIEAMCLGLQTATDKVTYNRCRLETSILQISYRGDADVCDNEAKALYPQAARSRQPDLTISESSGSVTTIKSPRPTFSDFRSGRRYIFDRCMADKGWRNARNWQLGQIR